MKSPEDWVNVHLKDTKLNVANKWWGEAHDDGGETVCYIDSLGLGNEADKGPDCKGDVNDRWVICIRQPKVAPSLIDPDDPGIVEDDPYPPEDTSNIYYMMQYKSVLDYVDKKQAKDKNLYLPKKSLLTYDIQVRIDHKPSIVYKQLSHVIGTASGARRYEASGKGKN